MSPLDNQTVAPASEDGHAGWRASVGLRPVGSDRNGRPYLLQTPALVPRDYRRLCSRGKLRSAFSRAGVSAEISGWFLGRDRFVVVAAAVAVAFCVESCLSRLPRRANALVVEGA